MVLSELPKIASYLTKRLPLNCASDAPLVKYVAAVPSGPTKLKGPAALLLAATCNLSVVLAGTVAFQEIVPHVGVMPDAGLASLADEINVPDAAKPVFMYVLKWRSLFAFCPAGVEQDDVLQT